MALCIAGLHRCFLAVRKHAARPNDRAGSGQPDGLAYALHATNDGRSTAGKRARCHDRFG